MERAVKFRWIVLVFITVGCAHMPFMGKPQEGGSQADSQMILNDHLKQSRMINAEALKQGRNIAIVPFTAGVGVEANATLDRVSLMIIKGFSDAVNAGQEQFTVLTAENFQTADFVVQGHINIVRRPSKLRRWILLKKRKSLGVDGKMIDTKTGEAVAVFTDVRRSAVPSDDYDQLGYQIGKNIGLFILSGAKQ